MGPLHQRMVKGRSSSRNPGNSQVKVASALGEVVTDKYTQRPCGTQGCEGFWEKGIIILVRVDDRSFRE